MAHPGTTGLHDDDGLANKAKVKLTLTYVALCSTYRDLRQLCQWVLGSLNHTAHYSNKKIN